jgi:lysophospholipase L1-like esterase
VLLGPGAGAVHAATTPLDYYALGDSVASGRGLMDSGGACRRSAMAYPEQVRDLLAARRGAVRFRLLACAGAEAASGSHSLRRQVDAVLRSLTKRPTIVSLTIGANDTDWSDIPLTYARIRDPDADGFVGWIRGVAASVERAALKQLRRLLERPNVRIVLTDYFNPVNPQSLLFGPPVPCAEAAVCYARTELIVDELNGVLRGLPAELRARGRIAVAGIHGAFRGHESPAPECGTGTPGVEETWIQYPTDPASNSNPGLPPGVPGPWSGDCFHPNELGAAAIAAAVDRAAKRLGR